MCEPVIRPLPAGDIPPEARPPLERLSGRPESCNLLRTVAHSPAALGAFAGQVAAAGDMRLPGRIREAIALCVAELNGSKYCLAAHKAWFDCLGEDADTIRRFRQGLSEDPREQTLLALTTKLVLDRGHHTKFAVETARELGVSDEEIVEVVALVALNTFTNYLTSLAETEIEFPSDERSGIPRLICDSEQPRR